MSGVVLINGGRSPQGSRSAVSLRVFYRTPPSCQVGFALQPGEAMARLPNLGQLGETQDKAIDLLVVAAGHSIGGLPLGQLVKDTPSILEEYLSARRGKSVDHAVIHDYVKVLLAISTLYDSLNATGSEAAGSAHAVKHPVKVRSKTQPSASVQLGSSNQHLAGQYGGASSVPQTATIPPASLAVPAFQVPPSPPVQQRVSSPWPAVWYDPSQRSALKACMVRFAMNFWRPNDWVVPWVSTFVHFVDITVVGLPRMILIFLVLYVSASIVSMVASPFGADS